jgi:hypothetical protein
MILISELSGKTKYKNKLFAKMGNHPLVSFMHNNQEVMTKLYKKKREKINKRRCHLLYTELLSV